MRHQGSPHFKFLTAPWVGLGTAHSSSSLSLPPSPAPTLAAPSFSLALPSRTPQLRELNHTQPKCPLDATAPTPLSVGGTGLSPERLRCPSSYPEPSNTLSQIQVGQPAPPRLSPLTKHQGAAPAHQQILPALPRLEPPPSRPLPPAGCSPIAAPWGWGTPEEVLMMATGGPRSAPHCLSHLTSQGPRRPLCSHSTGSPAAPQTHQAHTHSAWKVLPQVSTRPAPSSFRSAQMLPYIK